MDIAEDMARTVAGRDDWTRSSEDEWRTEEDGGRLVGLVRVAAGALEAQVLREATGPTPGPNPEEAHGPRVFEEADVAVAYVDANLGRDLSGHA